MYSRTPGQPPWIFAVAAHGNLELLPFTVGLTAPFRADFKGDAHKLTSHWNWLGSASVAEFDLRAWGGGGALGPMSGELTASGDVTGFKARGSITSPGLGVGPFDAIFEGAYASNVLTATRIDLTHHASGAHLTGVGTIGIVDKGPRLMRHFAGIGAEHLDAEWNR